MCGVSEIYEGNLQLLVATFLRRNTTELSTIYYILDIYSRFTCILECSFQKKMFVMILM